MATPVTWDELAEASYRADARSLIFSPEAVLERVERLGDLHAGVQQEGYVLPAAKAEEKRSR